MPKWRATGQVFARFEYLILLKTPYLNFGRWRVDQVETLACYCDHEGLCAQIDRARCCGDVITLGGFATRIKRPDPTGKTRGVSLIVTSVHTHFSNALRRLRPARASANAN
jgi:hypothetical protein